MVRLRSALHVLVVLGLALSTQGYMLARVAFAVRQGYIAERLCENRDRPETHCNGRCYLLKQMEAEREHERQRRAAGFELLFAAAPLVPVAPALTAPAPRVTPPWAVLVVTEPAAGPPTGIFHPPRVG